MAFVGRVALEPTKEAGLFDRGLWCTVEPLIYKSARFDVVVSVPVGFKTDLASIPRILPITYALTGGTAIKAALIHDYIYHYPVYHNDKRKRLPRHLCDDIFYQIMCEEGVPKWRRNLMWLGVRVGGWFAYG